MVTQTAQSPGLNINDLGFLASMKSSVWGEHFGSIDGLVEGAKKMFYEHDSEMLERVWQSQFMRYNQILREMGGTISIYIIRGQERGSGRYLGQISLGRPRGQQCGAILVG